VCGTPCWVSFVYLLLNWIVTSTLSPNTNFTGALLVIFMLIFFLKTQLFISEWQTEAKIITQLIIESVPHGNDPCQSDLTFGKILPFALAVS